MTAGPPVLPRPTDPEKRQPQPLRPSEPRNPSDLLPQNHFVERHIPLLTAGATLARKQQALLSTRRRQRVFLSVTPDLSFLEETEELESQQKEEYKEEPSAHARSGGYAGAAGGGGADVAGGHFAGGTAGGAGVGAAVGSGARRGLSRGRGGVTRSYPMKDVESVEPVIETSGWGLGGDDGGVSALLVIRLRGKEEVSGAERGGNEQAERKYERPRLWRAVPLFLCVTSPFLLFVFW